MGAIDSLFDLPERGAPSVVPVVVPVAVDTAYSYRVPAGLTVAPGSIVSVPLGPREVVGVVWDEEPVEVPVGHNRLKSIASVFDAPPLDAETRRFVDWVSHYYVMPRGMVLRMVLRSTEALEPEPPIRGVRLAGPPPERLTPARRRVLEVLEGGVAWSRVGLAASAGVSPAVVEGLVAAGTLETVELRPGRAVEVPDPNAGPLALSEDQAAAGEVLREASRAGGFKVHLLDGVTGSGKTEVYFEAIAETLRAGRQALVLLPEIALTAEFVDRFAARFGARPAEWHSEVPARQRARVWRGVATGEVRAVIGARSALFLPFRELGLVVVDEEHDGAYKQDEGVVYNARDMAVVRGRLGGFPVVLASATPSIESRVNADQGRYRRLILPSRVGGAKLPEIFAVDLRRNGLPRGRTIAPVVEAAVRQALARGEQALLFLNRRGYAPLTLCRSCGHRFECPNCSTWLVEHRFRGVLTCHHCGHTVRRPEACPACGDVDSLTACGPGIERVAEEAATLFPDARRMVLSSDLPGGSTRLKQELAAVAKGETDIVVGTQLVAKGHNFPKMTVVGVVDADLGLAHGDPRAAEKTFQLLQQVTGRAGRAGGAARGYLQTHAPDHPVLKAIVAGDRERFYETEIEERRRAFMPPFSRLCGVIVSADTREAAQAAAQALAREAPDPGEIRILGPAEAPLAVVRARHRFRLLLIAPKPVDLQAFLARWLAGRRWGKGGVKVHVDVDPQSFL